MNPTLEQTHSVSITVAEMADGDDYDDNDVDQDPDLISALPWDLEHVPLEFKRLPVEETMQRSLEFYNLMNSRRTVRFFSCDPVPADVIRNIIRAAGRFLKNWYLNCTLIVLHCFQIPVTEMPKSYNDASVTGSHASDKIW